MNRIVIELYDHATSSDVEQMVADVKNALQPSGDVWSVRREVRDLNALEIHASEKVWRASQNYERVELSRDETQALWQRILNDSTMARSLRAR